MAHQLKERVLKQMEDVSLRPGVEVIDAEDILTFFQKTLAEVRPDKPRPAGHQHTNMV